MADYPIPPWLSQTPNWGGIAAGVASQQQAAKQHADQLAQSAVQFHSQMAMKAAQFQTETEMKQQQLEQQSMLQQHKLAIEGAYQQAKLGLEMQQLDRYNKALDFKAKEASDQLGRLKAWDTSFKQTHIENPTMSPERTFQENYMNNGGAETFGAKLPTGLFSGSRTGTASRVDANGKPIPPDPMKIGGKLVIQQPSGTYTVLGEEPKEFTPGFQHIGGNKWLRTMPNGKQIEVTKPAFKFDRQTEMDAIYKTYPRVLDKSFDASTLSDPSRFLAAKEKYEALRAEKQKARETYDKEWVSKTEATIPDSISQDTGQSPEAEEATGNWGYDQETGQMEPTQ